MIYQLESINRVLDKITRDLGIGSDEVPYQDFIEWCADALEHIGSYYQMSEKECLVVIDGFRGNLPCDFVNLIDIIESVSILPGETGFYGNSLAGWLETQGVDYTEMNAYERYVIYPKTMDSYTTKESELVFNKGLFGDVELNQFGSKDYNISNNTIITAMEYGIFRIKYLAMAVDENGIPLVPDNPSFRDALFWRVAMQLSMRNPELMNNPVMKDFRYCKQQWDYYCIQARAEANMPDKKMLERMKNNFYRMIPDLSPENTKYKNLGTPQRLNFNGIS